MSDHGHIEWIGTAVNRPYKEAGYAPRFRDKGARARQNWKRRRAAGRG